MMKSGISYNLLNLHDEVTFLTQIVKFLLFVMFNNLIMILSLILIAMMGFMCCMHAELLKMNLSQLLVMDRLRMECFEVFSLLASLFPFYLINFY